MDRMIERRHIASMLLDLLRGLLVTGAALLLGVPLLRLAAPAWRLPDVVARRGLGGRGRGAGGRGAAVRRFAPPGALLLLAASPCGSGAAADREPLPRRVVMEMFLRSFAIQGSWNYRTLQGSGFAFALMPVLRWVHGADPDRLQDAVSPARQPVQRASVPVRRGARRRGADGGGRRGPALIERFKSALRSSLGTLGDRIVWAGWRPACVLLGLFVLLATESRLAGHRVPGRLQLGPPGLRWWGLQIGLEHGRGVGDALRQAPLVRWHETVVGAAALLLGWRAAAGRRGRPHREQAARWLIVAAVAICSAGGRAPPCGMPADPAGDRHGCRLPPAPR
jgi:mannose PTS system EIID component